MAIPTRRLDRRTVARAGQVLALLAAAVAIGCGPRRPARVPVSGKVLIDGQPLRLGYVRFVPQGARPSGGPIRPDGRFRLNCFGGEDGAVPGSHRVSVDASETLGRDSKRWHAPKHYADFTTSGLEVEIDGPTDSLVIELSWDGGKPFVERYEPEPAVAGAASPPDS